MKKSKRYAQQSKITNITHSKNISLNAKAEKNEKLLFLKTVTPLHVGGNEGTGFVDMPIQREAATNIPKVEGSSFKGALRESYIKLFDESNPDTLFGRTDNGGQAAFTDLRLLFFPVKSSLNIFSLITCPYVLNRFSDDIFMYNLNEITGLEELIDHFTDLNEETVLILDDETKNADKDIFLEDYLFKVKSIKIDNLFKEVPNLKESLKRIVIVPNEVFIDFVTYYTEVVTRNRIDYETKTTKDTGLFTQEYVPSEAIFYGVVSRFFDILDKEKGNEIYKGFINNLGFDKILNKLQLGGNSTLGKGLVKFINN